jgi:hypothetical protein
MTLHNTDEVVDATKKKKSRISPQWDDFKDFMIKVISYF